MIEYPSFTLDVNQFGYYNTVEVSYNGGTVKESYEDLAQVFGEIVKKIEEPDMNKIEAQGAAKSRLATLLRDFGMEVQLEILHSSAILPGTFIRVANPLTKNEETYFVSGINLQQEPTTSLMCSLTLLYAPKNPEVSTIPEIAGGVSLGGLDAICQAQKTYGASIQNLCSSASCYVPGRGGDCWADSEWLYNQLEAAGIPARIMAYVGGGNTWSSRRHAWVQYNNGTTWTEFPYGQCGGHYGDTGAGTPYVIVSEGKGNVTGIMATTGY